MPGIRGRRRLSSRAGLLALVLCALTAPTAGGAVQRASLADIQSQVMCVTCGIPLELAVSPQADRERAGIQAMIDKGMTATQIKQALVQALGPGVLALPPRSGFDLAVYIVPVAVILALLLVLAVGLRRWRRRDPIEDSPAPSATDFEPLEASRLDDDLARFNA